MRYGYLDHNVSSNKKNKQMIESEHSDWKIKKKCYNNID